MDMDVFGKRCAFSVKKRESGPLFWVFSLQGDPLVAAKRGFFADFAEKLLTD